MIKLENTVLPSPEQWETIVRGTRNPFNSWYNSDSRIIVAKTNFEPFSEKTFIIGDKDKKLLMRLSNAGTDHGKFMRMITVYVDITAPLYFFKEMETYKVGTVSNSCSTMHTITEKEFTLDDFSCEHLSYRSIENLKDTIGILNDYRIYFANYKDGDIHIDDDGRILSKKELWWQMIQLLPSSYNQKRTFMFNYAVLKNIYNARKNHKLDEWHDFCHWIETLPYAKELIIWEDETNE